MTGCTVSQYEQFEISPETIEQELRPAVCEHRQTDRYKENYSIDIRIILYGVRWPGWLEHSTYDRGVLGSNPHRRRFETLGKFV